MELYHSKMRKSLSGNQISYNRDEMLLERLSRKSVDCVNVYLLFMNLFSSARTPRIMCYGCIGEVLSAKVYLTAVL